MNKLVAFLAVLSVFAMIFALLRGGLHLAAQEDPVIKREELRN